MSSTDCRAVAGSARLSGATGRDPATLWRRLRAWLRARRTQRELIALDDRTLRDIGLTRRALARHYRRRHFWW